MSKFRVFIEGRNFLIADEEGQAKYGFYTTRFVEAENAAAAELAAIELLRNRKSLRETTLNTPEDSPMMYVTEIVELLSFDGIANLEPGLAWFAADEA